MPDYQHPLHARRAQLDNFTDASTSVGNIAWRGNVNGNANLREVVEPFPAAPANCTMRQFRQTTPAVPQPPNGHKLIFHSLSGCWLDPAQACAAPTLLSWLLCGCFICALHTNVALNPP